jgi:hypothetical protein
MCNILIYFYKIDIKHLQHTSKIATWAFSAMSPYYFNKWWLVVAELVAARRLSAVQGARGDVEL